MEPGRIRRAPRRVTAGDQRDRDGEARSVPVVGLQDGAPVRTAGRADFRAAAPLRRTPRQRRGCGDNSLIATNRRLAPAMRPGKRPVNVLCGWLPLQLSDYGTFGGPGATTLAGAPATVEEQRERGCRFRVRRVQLPGTSSTSLTCSPEHAADCEPGPAQATIATFCTSPAACLQVDTILAGARFGPKPWPTVPLSDPDLGPEEPACSPR